MEVGRYRKRPVEVEAVQLVGNFGYAIEWVNSNGGQAGQTTGLVGPGVGIITLEGTMVAREGDWIIRGVQGEFYPCKPDIFSATYEHVTPTPGIAADYADSAE